MSKAIELKARLINTGVAREDQFQGCSPFEIGELERLVGRVRSLQSRRLCGMIDHCSSGGP